MTVSSFAASGGTGIPLRSILADVEDVDGSDIPSAPGQSSDASGKPVQLTVERDGRTANVTVTIADVGRAPL